MTGSGWAEEADLGEPAEAADPALGPVATSACALIESRAREVGLAVLYRRSMEFELMQFGDSGNYSRTVAAVLALEPAAVVMSRTSRGTQLLRVLEDALQETGLPEPLLVERRHFDETEGQSLLEEADVVGIQPSEYASRFVACAAFTALWHFAQSSMDLRLRISAVHVNYCGASDSLIVDNGTARVLELVRNASGQRENGSMFSLFSCRTPGGARLLRQSLLQPSASKSEIEARQVAVEALLSNEQLFFELQRLLPEIGDADLLAARLAVEPKSQGQQWCKAAIRTALRLRQALVALPALAEALRAPATKGSALLLEARAGLAHSELAGVLQELERVLDGDGLPKQGGKGSMAHAALMHSVRPNVSALLDVARQAWNDAMEEVHALHRSYSLNYPDLSLRLEFTERRGWHLSHSAQGIPPEFINTAAQKGASGRQMSMTRELNAVNFKLRQAEREILTQTLGVLSTLFGALCGKAALLYRVAHAASVLDLLQALAGYALLVGNCTQPELSEDPSAPIAIKAGRHPLRERLLAKDASSGGFEPLDFFIGDDCHFQAVTGQNGGGKSTYMQTLAQLVILAQIGCRVPAQYATMRVTTSLFTRIGSTDNIEASASTFLVEMQEAAHVLRNVVPRSLVLIDELGRGTAHLDGLAICWAVCERLLEMRVYTLFATHFFEVCRLQGAFPGFRNMHIQAMGGPESGAQRQYTVHHMTSLPALLERSRQRYGIRAAEQAGLPQGLVRRARELAACLEEQLAVRLPGVEEEPEAPHEQEALRRLFALGKEQPAPEVLRAEVESIQRLLLAGPDSEGG